MSEHWKQIDLAPESDGDRNISDDAAGAAEDGTDLAERLRPLVAPGLVVGSFVLVAPLGYGFAVLAAMVVATILYLTRRSAGTASDQD